MLRAIYRGKTGLFLGLVLAVILLLDACTAKPSSPPAPVSTAKPAPAAQPRAEQHITAFTMGTGSTPYAMFHALADMVNKEHPWLRINVREGTGASAHLKLLATDAAKRKDTIVFSTEYANNKALKGIKPFDAPYEGGRAIATYGWNSGGLATTDPNIKTPNDMKGKRAICQSLTNILGELTVTLIKDVWKIGDQVKISHGESQAVVAAIQDKLADIATVSCTGTPGTFEKTQTSAWVTEMLTTTKMYFFPLSRDDMVKAGEAIGHPIAFTKLPPGKIAPQQPEQYVYVQSMGWWAAREMDEDIVYEVTKAIVENADRFKKYTAEGELMTRENASKVPVPEEQFHPGALRYYKEHGMSVGMK